MLVLTPTKPFHFRDASNTFCFRFSVCSLPAQIFSFRINHIFLLFCIHSVYVHYFTVVFPFSTGHFFMLLFTHPTFQKHIFTSFLYFHFFLPLIFFSFFPSIFRFSSAISFFYNFFHHSCFFSIFRLI